MSAGGKSLSGGCLCGAVRFTATAAKPEISACHCSMCRKWSGGPWLAIECGDSLKIENPDAVSAFRSSEWAERCSCATCGTALYYKLVGKDYYVVSAEACDDLTGFEFVREIFIDEKPAYYAFANETQKMTGAEVFAAFMSGGEG